MHLLWVECRFGLAAAFRHKPGSVGTGRCCNARSRTAFPRLLGGRNDVRLSAEAAALVDPALCVQLLLGRGAFVAEDCCRRPRSARVLALRKRTSGDLSQCTPWPVFARRAGAAAPACVFLAGHGCLTRTTHVWKLVARVSVSSLGTLPARRAWPRLAPVARAIERPRAADRPGPARTNPSPSPGAEC